LLLVRYRDLEGIVAKRKDDSYADSVRWVKIKNPGYSQAVGRAAAIEVTAAQDQLVFGRCALEVIQCSAAHDDGVQQVVGRVDVHGWLEVALTQHRGVGDLANAEPQASDERPRVLRMQTKRHWFTEQGQ